MQRQNEPGTCPLGEDAKLVLKQAYDTFGFSARSMTRVMRVARTIADLDGSAEIQPQHLAEAIQYRTSNLGA